MANLNSRLILGLACCLAPACALQVQPAAAKVRVVASTSDLAYLAGEIGGGEVEAGSIASPRADVHYVEVRPSYMVQISRADLVLKVGLELDQWMDKLIDGSRNADAVITDCSAYVEPMEVPDFKPDARHGDLHRFGNPHYWTSPDNLPAVTRAIQEGLAQADPAKAELYAANRDRFLQETESALLALRARARPLEGVEMISFHNSWPYFNAYLGLKAAGFIEPYPGVPPTPTHLSGLVDLIKDRGIRIIAVEPYFDRRVPDKLARETGAVVVPLYPSVGGAAEGESYAEWLEGNVERLLGALP